MPTILRWSNSLAKWEFTRLRALDEIANAHRMVGGFGPGRRFATQQLNHAYAVLLSSQFQGLCRDLHSECVRHLVRRVTPATLIPILEAEFVQGRKLDKGNPNPGNIGSDFTRFGIKFWDRVLRHDARNADRKMALELLNEWRNAIAHQDFDSNKLGGTTILHLTQVRRWRNACHELAHSFNDVMSQHITSILGVSPW